MAYPPFSAMANILVRAEKKEMAMRMSSELGLLLTPPPEKLKIMGPAEAPVPRRKNEYRYQFLVKAASRKALVPGFNPKPDNIAQTIGIPASSHKQNAARAARKK